MPNVKERIAERNRLAQVHNRDRNVVSRAISRAGLAIANTWDRITAPINSDGMAFAEGTIFGGLQGGIVGGLLGITAGLLMGVAGAAMVPYALVPAVGGALFKAYQYSDYAVQQNSEIEKGHTARRIAEISGAIPTRKHILETDVREPRGQFARQQQEDTSRYTKNFAAEEKRRAATRSGPTVLR